MAKKIKPRKSKGQLDELWESKTDREREIYKQVLQLHHNQYGMVQENFCVIKDWFTIITFLTANPKSS